MSKRTKNRHNETQNFEVFFNAKYKTSFFIDIELFFAAEFIYENSFRLCALHFRLFYNNFKYIFNKNGNEQ